MSLTDAKKRLLELLKRHGAQTPGELAATLETTAVAARQHLQALSEEGHVSSAKRAASGRGRPATEWALTERGHALFPDRHGELTVALLDAAREAFGEQGVQRLLAIRSQQQETAYRLRVDQEPDLAGRVAALAAIRSEEGYMAEALPLHDSAPGSNSNSESAADTDSAAYLLVEHHCPICEAARSCAGLCAAELDVFRRTLGPDVEVRRTRHILAGDARCAYRVEKRARDRAPSLRPDCG